MWVRVQTCYREQVGKKKNNEEQCVVRYQTVARSMKGLANIVNNRFVGQQSLNILIPKSVQLDKSMNLAVQSELKLKVT